MSQALIDRHMAKLRARNEVSPAEEEAIRSALGEVREVKADACVIPAYVDQQHSTLLLDGLLCRYKDLRNGRRQITELHVPGDFADLHSFTLKYLDHNIMSLTPARIATFPHENLKAITEQFPRLTRTYWFQTNLDAAIQREWAVALGQRTARGRLALLLCELQVRLDIVGLADEYGYDLPLTQTELGECTGMTSVHVNRILRELREDGLVHVQGARVELTDLPALQRAAEFDPAYLYLGKRAR